jgi:hypothetical protein
MACGVHEIDAAPAVLRVGFTWSLHLRIGPVLDTPCSETSVCPVELVVVDQKGVVLHLDLDRGFRELQQYAVVELEVGEYAP